MRILFAIMIPIVLFGGIATYIEFTERVRPEPVREEAVIDTANYVVRAATTWPLAGDPDYDAPALSISFRGTNVLEIPDALAPFTWRDSPLSEITRGENSLYVEAVWDDTIDDAKGAVPSSFAAVRIQVLRNDEVVTDYTMWRQPGISDQSGMVIFHSSRDQSPTDSQTGAEAIDHD